MICEFLRKRRKKQRESRHNCLQEDNLPQLKGNRGGNRGENRASKEMERECEEGEMEKKLRRSFMGYTRRAGPSTPPPTWRLEFSPPRVGATKEFLANSEDSVRKLCADLWETEQFRQRIELRRCRRRDSDVESHSRSPLHDHVNNFGAFDLLECF